MRKNWADCKSILCIRADNLGDLLMSSPAIHALKEFTHAKITILTSSMAAGVAPFISGIDDVITCNLPWVKSESDPEVSLAIGIINMLKNRHFDAAVIFTVYSQSALPAAMLAYMSGIPLRLAYCRENPYALLTDWLPDKEPYGEIKHQVQRDLDLVAMVGATTDNEELSLRIDSDTWDNVLSKMLENRLDPDKPWLILHAGVSEEKRRYHQERWVEIGRRLIAEHNIQIIFTGSPAEATLTETLQKETGAGSFSAGGVFDLKEFIALIAKAPLVISVNTATIHIAAATKTPVIVLYALTNPQHAPWKGYGKVFPFGISKSIQSKNEIIRYVNDKYFISPPDMPSVHQIVEEATAILNGKREVLPELITSLGREAFSAHH